MDMNSSKMTRPEDMDGRQLAEFIVDLAHRMSVHQTLWFREVEHQLGLERALAVMDEAWDKTRRISVERLSKELGYKQTDGTPDMLIDMPRDEQLSLADAIAKNWLAQDGVWFQAVETAYGMNDAKRCNDSTWSRYSPFEAHCIKRLLDMEEHPGLTGLERALSFRMYGRLNVQSLRWEDGALIYEMNECRVQSARKRRCLPDYPCKSAGLVEYARFAEGIDSRIMTECIGCPPDEHPNDWCCAWRFFMRDDI